MYDFMVIKEVTISEFKAKCLAILKQLHKSKKPIRITRFAGPVAELIPLPPRCIPAGWAR
jgi:PHD/YefM family antitoxin component YafN of YafNO toxin-antitoxin module